MVFPVVLAALRALLLRLISKKGITLAVKIIAAIVGYETAEAIVESLLGTGSVSDEELDELREEVRRQRDGGATPDVAVDDPDVEEVRKIALEKHGDDFDIVDELDVRARAHARERGRMTPTESWDAAHDELCAIERDEDECCPREPDQVIEHHHRF